MRSFIILSLFFVSFILRFSNCTGRVDIRPDVRYVNCSSIDGKYWKEIWSSNFDDLPELNNLWNVENEESYCSGNGLNQLNCNTRNNIVIKDGYAFLIAKHEKYSDKEYTGATMTTRRAFTHGRWEIRARLPRGDLLRPSMFTRNESELYWHDLGQLDLGSYGQGGQLFRGIHYANSTNKYQKVDVPFSSAPVAKLLLTDQFHLYGVEWTPNDVRFFWDSSYSKWYNFSEKLSMGHWHNIRLQIGVGGLTLGNIQPTSVTDESWTCPALIVDYVRIYEPMASKEFCGRMTIHGTTNFDFAITEAKIISEICKNYQPEQRPKEVSENIAENNVVYPHIHQVFMYGIILVVAILIIWIILQIRALRRKLDIDLEIRNNMEMSRAQWVMK